MGHLGLYIEYLRIQDGKNKKKGRIYLIYLIFIWRSLIIFR